MIKRYPDEVYESIRLSDRAIEKAHRDFLHNARMLDINELAVPNRRRSQEQPVLPEQIQDIGFVAVTSRYPSATIYYPYGLGHSYDQSDPNAKWQYYEYGKISRPYFDGHMGLCLASGRVPFAACSGGLTASGPLIMQIQGLAKREHNQEIPKGFDWKLTLVRAMVELWQESFVDSSPAMSDKPTTILSADNNKWVTVVSLDYLDSKTRASSPEVLSNGRIVSDDTRYNRVKQAYGGVAKTLGSRMLDTYGNHVLPSEFNMPSTK